MRLVERFRVLVFLAEDFLADDFLADDFRADDLRAGDLRADDLEALFLRAGPRELDFRAPPLLRAGFFMPRDADFRDDDLRAGLLRPPDLRPAPPLFLPVFEPPRDDFLAAML